MCVGLVYIRTNLEAPPGELCFSMGVLGRYLTPQGAAGHVHDGKRKKSIVLCIFYSDLQRRRELVVSEAVDIEWSLDSVLQRC